jgi:hypothetical protein
MAEGDRDFRGMLERVDTGWSVTPSAPAMKLAENGSTA